jgi:cell division protein FtsZ
MLSEGPARCNQAAEGIDELKKYVDSLLVLNNDSIRQQFGKLPVTKAFSKADDVLASATKGIAEIITVDSAFIRVDFADLEKVMRGSGRAHMGVAKASGDGRAMEAARLSLCSPLLDSNSISGSTKVLINIAAKDVDNITYEEVNEIVDYIQAYASCKLDDNSTQNANIIWGVSSKATLGDDEIEVVAPETAGSTAVVALLSQTQIIVANCGDSRAVLYRGKEAIALSSDHKVRHFIIVSQFFR